MTMEIKQDGNKVVVTLSVKLAYTNYNFPFSYDCGAEWIAKMLSQELRVMASDNLALVRKKAYLQGVDDKKKRKTLANWFTGAWAD